MSKEHDKEYGFQLIAEYRDNDEEFAYRLTGKLPKSGSALMFPYRGLSKVQVVKMEYLIKEMMDSLFACSKKELDESSS